MPRAYGFLFAWVFPSTSGTASPSLGSLKDSQADHMPAGFPWKTPEFFQVSSRWAALLGRFESHLCYMSLCILFTYMICFCLGYFYIDFSFPEWELGEGRGGASQELSWENQHLSSFYMTLYIWIFGSWLSLNSLIWRSPSFLLPFSTHLLPQSAVPSGFLEK